MLQTLTPGSPSPLLTHALVVERAMNHIWMMGMAVSSETLFTEVYFRRTWPESPSELPLGYIHHSAQNLFLGPRYLLHFKFFIDVAYIPYSF